MRILQLTKYFPPAPGGMESYAQDLSKALVAAGHDNLVLAHQYEKGEPSSTTGPAGRIIRVPSCGEIMYAPMAPTCPTRLWSLLRTFKPDVLLVHMPNVSAFWLLFMELPCKLAVLWHADVIFPEDKVIHNFAYKAYSRLESKLLHKADLIIATSPPYLAYSTPLRPFADKSVAIPLGIDFNRIPSLSHDDVESVLMKMLGRKNVRYVYAAGRFSHYKGFDRLVEAARSIRADLPDMEIFIAGDGETRPAILSLIKERGLEDFVHCPGRVSDHEYWALMKGCEMFCLPSVERTEAFGIVLLEAMTQGKPCISTSIQGSGTGWVNIHGQTGLVVKPDDIPALHDVIVSLANSPELRAQYGNNGIQRVHEKFGIESAAHAVGEQTMGY